MITTLTTLVIILAHLLVRGSTQTPTQTPTKEMSEEELASSLARTFGLSKALLALRRGRATRWPVVNRAADGAFWRSEALVGLAAAGEAALARRVYGEEAEAHEGLLECVEALWASDEF